MCRTWRRAPCQAAAALRNEAERLRCSTKLHPDSFAGHRRLREEAAVGRDPHAACPSAQAARRGWPRLGGIALCSAGTASAGARPAVGCYYGAGARPGGSVPPQRCRSLRRRHPQPASPAAARPFHIGGTRPRRVTRRGAPGTAATPAHNGPASRPRPPRAGCGGTDLLLALSPSRSWPHGSRGAVGRWASGGAQCCGLGLSMGRWDSQRME